MHASSAHIMEMERRPLCGCSMASLEMLQLQAFFASLVPIHFLLSVYNHCFSLCNLRFGFYTPICTQTTTTTHYYPIKTDIYVSALNPKVPTSASTSCRAGPPQRQLVTKGEMAQSYSECDVCGRWLVGWVASHRTVTSLIICLCSMFGHLVILHFIPCVRSLLTREKIHPQKDSTIQIHMRICWGMCNLLLQIYLS